MELFIRIEMIANPGCIYYSKSEYKSENQGTAKIIPGTEEN
jgi:hypothetical protein